MSSVSERKSDLWIAFGLLVFCAFVAFLTPSIKSGMGSSVTGPKMIPWMMIGGIAILSVLMIVRSVLASKSADAEDGQIEIPNPRTLLTIVAFVGLLVAYAAAFFPIGYIPATLTTFVAGLWLLGERRWFVLVLFPLAMTTIVYFGFTKLLSVWLP